MKIVMLSDAYFEGLQYQENLLTKYYLKQGHQVVIISSTFESIFDYYADNYNKNIPASTIERDNLKIIKLPFSLNILNRLRKFTGVFQILEVEKPDLIYLHNIHLNISDSVKYIKRNPDCKMIMDYHCDFSNSAKNWLSLYVLHKIIRKFILYRGLKYIHKIYPTVPAGFKFLEEVYGISPNKMELLPLGADTDEVNKINKEELKKSVRQELGIPEDGFVIFTGGKLLSIKKTDQLVKAVNLINNTNIYLIIGGDVNKDEPAYKTYLLNECDKNENIKFMGWVNSHAINSYMAASDVAIYPGSQSVLWQQSIGFGLPIVIGKYVTLENGKCLDQEVEYLNFSDNLIVLYEKDDMTDEIVKSIEKLLNKKVLEIMKSNAKFVAKNFLSYEAISLKTLEL